MLFNSFTFLIFLPIVFLIYWSLRSLKWQNLFIVAASYLFYGWWDWRFLFLIALTSIIAWWTGLLIERSHAKQWLTFSLVVNLAILGFFKYFGFFEEQAVELLQTLGFQANVTSLRILLPVGISFYTFQALSYNIDVYRRSFRAVRDPVAFFAYVSFFPQLVAGPIERATNLLPQILAPRHFDYANAVEGCRLMLWGFVKKVLIADACAAAANNAFNNPSNSSISLWVGIFCFTFQIYGDFSGYSDIAIGCSRLFGIRLMRNFAYPYFARDIAEFWRRWHISLTTWFRDYLYIPLGGSRGGIAKKIRNTFIIFLVSGFWHGANWTFLAWGFFHACCFLPLLLAGRNRVHLSDTPRLRDFWRMAITFGIVMLGWVFFRAPSITTAFMWLKKMLLFNDLRLTLVGLNLKVVTHAVIAIVILLIIEWFNRTREIPWVPQNKWLRWTIYYIFAILIFLFRPTAQPFVYFQF
ncbi:MAG: MBOAT family O-acyltransferase [Kiritimatiellia bacterium]